MSEQVHKEMPLFPEQEIKGTLEDITYYNEENGYTVAKFLLDGDEQKVTVVGHLPGIHSGESLQLRGLWTTHPTYGRQFEVHSYRIMAPTTRSGIERYLGSGLIRGVGPVTARRIVDHFGLETLEIIENHPERLIEVPSIGRKRIKIIQNAWEEQKNIRDVMIFLQSYNISTSLALKIYKQYGDQSIQVLREDTYQLAREIFGVGFKTADRIAMEMGQKLDSPARIMAGITYTLENMSYEGHCFAHKDELISRCAGILNISGESIQAEIDSLIDSKKIIAEGDAIYLPHFYYAETGVAVQLEKLTGSSIDRLDMLSHANWGQLYQWLDKVTSFQLTDEQKKAVKMSLTEKVSILTGGPGTGKSTITDSIIKILQSFNCTALLAAPTGRAAKRLNETTGLHASTLHRLLEYSPRSNQFLRNQKNPLDADLIIVDEASMVDIILMYHFLNAVKEGTHLLFVGDKDQLPSVGAGNVLRDLIISEVLPATFLNTIFRQAEGSYIISNAHRVNHGKIPIFDKNSADFFLFSESDPQKAADWVIDIVANRLNARFGYDPHLDVQVLSPMHRGEAGVRVLNKRLQQALNPAGKQKKEYLVGERVFRVGDRVMQVRNNYEKGIFNGDIGNVSAIDLEDQVVEINVEGNRIPYDYAELDELELAYAISIHKSQGSEFPVVVIPLLTQHYMMLQRNLLYTAITRARQKVVLVGSKKAIAMAVKNDKTTQRNTRLAEMLAQSKVLTAIYR
jgi:exodeoxyribonuclease V alpha subunit